MITQPIHSKWLVCQLHRDRERARGLANGVPIAGPSLIRQVAIRPVAAADHRNHTELLAIFLVPHGLRANALKMAFTLVSTKLGCEALPIEPFQC